MGFEPMDRGFADHCLTTWLCRQQAGLYHSMRLTARINKLVGFSLQQFKIAQRPSYQIIKQLLLKELHQ